MLEERQWLYQKEDILIHGPEKEDHMML